MKLSIEEFGKQLIETGDLDPVYIAIHGAKLPKPQLSKLLIAYFCFYHLGAAAWLSEQADYGNEDFWYWMKVAARNEQPPPVLKRSGACAYTAFQRWPRGSERRHFRGPKCVDSVWTLSNKTSEELIKGLIQAGTVPSILEAMQPWPLFGPWIAYKAADLLERVWGAPIQITNDVCLLYNSPRDALLQRAPDNPKQELERLLEVFSAYRAPPTYNRQCGPSEVETVLCKHGAYLNGTYWVGKDVHEVRHGLEWWGDTASRMLVASPHEIKHKGALF